MRSINQGGRRSFYLLPVIALFGMVSLFLCQPSAKMQNDDPASTVIQADGQKKLASQGETSIFIGNLDNDHAVSLFGPTATITVRSSADAGGTCPGATCTLRQAIATAASGDTINFDMATVTSPITCK